MSRAPGPRALALITTAAVALSVGRALPAPGVGSARSLDAPDWPTAIAVGPDGAVWLAVATDTPDFGGVARYGPDLEFEQAWGLAGTPRAAAVAPDGDVIVDEHPVGASVLSRFSADGRHQRSWSPGTTPVALDVAPGGDVSMLAQGDTDSARQVVTFAPDGTRTSAWPAEGADDATALAVGPDDLVYVTYYAGSLFGYTARFTPDGQRVDEWTILAIPTGLGFAPDGRLYVAGKSPDSPRGEVRIYGPDGAFAGGWVVLGHPEDLAVAPSGDVYLLVYLPDEFRYEVWRHDARGNVLDRLTDPHPVQGAPLPPTATSVSSATASPGATTTATAPSTPTAPVRTPTAPSTPAPTATPTGVAVHLPLAVRDAPMGPPTAP